MQQASETSDGLFGPPSGRWTPVSPALARLRHVLLAVAVLVVVVALVLLEMLVDLPTWLLVLGLVVAVGGGGWAALMVVRNVRSWGYAESEADLHIRHGAFFRKLVVVPYGRMQYVDVQAGPLEQLFNVASVRLHTAAPGTSARIPGVPKAEAARLRDRLTSLGEAQAAGL